MYFRLLAVGRHFRPNFAENDNLINSRVDYLLYTYHPQQTSATPKRAPEFISVQCIRLKKFLCKQQTKKNKKTSREKQWCLVTTPRLRSTLLIGIKI